MEAKKILIVDDEQDILDLLKYALEKAGYEVFVAKDGISAFKVAAKEMPDIAVLDIMMPGLDGIQLCQKFRNDVRFKKMYIVLLTARAEEYSEVAGFDAGADDYIIKPLKIRSLIKRLEVLGKREKLENHSAISVGDLVIDKQAYQITLEGQQIKLPKKEFELLFLLAKNLNKVVRRTTISSEVWGLDTNQVDKSIDVHIRRIRSRIGEERIETVKGIGYRLKNA